MGRARSTPAEEPLYELRETACVMLLALALLPRTGADMMTHPIFRYAMVNPIPTIIATVLSILLAAASMLLCFQPMTPFWGAFLQASPR